jgi:hypothetical protein
VRRPLSLLVIVGVVGLVVGLLIAGRPQDVPNDVVHTDIEAPSSAASTTLASPTVTTLANATSTSGETSTTSVVAPSTEVATAPATPATPPPALVPEANVRIVVANAANIAGLAARTADALRQLGYVNLVATDALGDRFDSVIYYVDGRYDEAMRLAAQLGLDPQRVHIRPGVTLTVNDDTSDIWLVLGQDRG